MSKFAPFDRVLVRDYDDQEWMAAIFSHTRTSGNGVTFYCAGGDFWKQCIPAEDREYLAGSSITPEDLKGGDK